MTDPGRLKPRHDQVTQSSGPAGNGGACIPSAACRASIGRPMNPQLQATLAKLPNKPGVYLLKDARGRVLYVGKAQSLRNRVRQYWQASRGSTQQPLRIEQAIDRVATSSTR